MNTLHPKPLKRISKGATFLTLPDMGGRRKRKEAPLPPLPAGDDTNFVLVDQYEKELARALNDGPLAKKIVNLKNTKYPYGTVPELIMLDYLMQRGERYKYQAQLFGGWRSGGLIPDFVVSRGGQARAFNIQGSYWHNVPGKREKDASDKLRMLGTYFDGEVITDVVFVWEAALMDEDRNSVMDDALVGIEHPS